MTTRTQIIEGVRAIPLYHKPTCVYVEHGTACNCKLSEYRAAIAAAIAELEKPEAAPPTSGVTSKQIQQWRAEWLEAYLAGTELRPEFLYIAQQEGKS